VTGNILDDEELIETLSSSKIMGTKIEEQVKQQEITAVQIAEVRQVYKHFCCKEVMMHHTIIHLQDSVTRIFARPHTKSPVAVAV
jgi:ABC-type oligopeptide transport system ATPase subunit